MPNPHIDPFSPRRHIRRTAAIFKGEYGRYTSLFEAMRVQSLSRAEIASMQLERLKQTLSQAKRHVPYWRELFSGMGFDPTELSSLSDLSTLPISTKATFREQGDRMISEQYSKGTLIPRQTGGSTGEPLHFYVDRKSHERQMAINLRSYYQAGIKEGDRVVKIWGYGRPLGHLNAIRYITGRMYLDAFDTSDSAVSAWIQAIMSFRPRAIYGYASAIGYLAKMILERAPADILVPVVMTTSERLFPHVRKDIRAAFKGEVIDTYGCHETVRLATECHCARMHLHPDAGYLEFVEGNGPSDSKRILLTTFLADAMPFIRYDLGDRGDLTEEHCGCGLPFATMRLADSRVHRLFSLPDRTIHSASIHKRIYPIPGVAQFQIHHTERDRIDVSVVPLTADIQALRDRLDAVCSVLQQELGPKTTLSHRFVEAIPKTSSGKNILVRSNVCEDQ